MCKTPQCIPKGEAQRYPHLSTSCSNDHISKTEKNLESNRSQLPQHLERKNNLLNDGFPIRNNGGQKVAERHSQGTTKKKITNHGQ